jgi:hypothetical protein
MESPMISSRDKTPDPLQGLANPRVIGLAAFMLTWIGFVSRRPDQWFTPQFIAEDGFVFFQDAAAIGWSSLIKPFAGYLHLAPRLIACATKEVPWEFLPMVYVVMASMVAALIGVRIALARLPWPVRIFGLIALIAAPHRGEVFLTITNLHWILGAVLAVNLLEPPPQTVREAWRRAAEIALVGLSGPMTVILAPFGLICAWTWRKQRGLWLMTIAWGFTLVVQAGFILTSERTIRVSLWSVLTDLRWLVPQYTAAFLVNHQLPYSPMLGWATVLLAVVALGLLYADRSNRHRRAGVMLMLASMVLLLAGRTTLPHWPHPQGIGARYLYLPFVLSMGSFAGLAFGTEKKALRTLALALFGLAIWASASAWVAHPLPDDHWAQQVREAREGSRKEFHVQPVDTFPVPSLPR